MLLRPTTPWPVNADSMYLCVHVVGAEFTAGGSLVLPVFSDGAHRHVMMQNKRRPTQESRATGRGHDLSMLGGRPCSFCANPPYLGHAPQLWCNVLPKFSTKKWLCFRLQHRIAGAPASSAAPWVTRNCCPRAARQPLTVACTYGNLRRLGRQPSRTPFRARA